MRDELEKIYYFMKRDIISFSTYKTNIAILVMTALFGALSFAYLGSSATSQSVLESYHMNLTTYLIIGLAFNILGTLIVLALGIGTFSGFSMIGAGILILTKQGDPVTALITIATSLFGNVLFPPQVMPAALQAISYFVPQYYFFTTIRQVLTGSSLLAILPDLLVLIIMCAIILPLGYLA